MQEIKYKEFTGTSLKEAAKIILSNRLFVNGWSLREVMKDWTKLTDSSFSRNPQRICYIAYEGDKPIGCCAVDWSVLNTFVRVSHRRKGIGKKMATMVAKHHSKFLDDCGRTRWSEGNKKISAKFYHSVGTDVEIYEM